MKPKSREQIQSMRPKMRYADYDASWTTVMINDRFAKSWIWGEGPYYDWCDETCTDKYNIVKYTTDTVTGRFKNAADATLFKLRWA